MASANLSITGIKGYNAGWSGWYSVGGGQDVYAGGESGSNIFTTAIRFTVPATTGISSGRSLTFSLWFLKGYYASTNLTYELTASAPKDGQRTPNGTVIKSGTLSLTNLTSGYKNFSLTLSNLSLPVAGGTYYLYLYNGYWCSFSNQSSYKASGSLSYTPHTKTTGWSISASSLALGSALTISLPAATEGNGSNKHWIVYKTSTGQEGTISWPTGFSTSVTWTPSLSLANGIPSATSMTCTITCATYASDGTTLVGTDTRSLTLTAPSNMVPSCTFSTLALNDGGKNNLLVKGISTLTASITGIAGSYGSSVNSYKFSIESTDGTVHWSTTGSVSGSTLSLTSPTLNIAISGTSATKRVRVVLTDSRGRTCAVTKDCTYYNYASPLITGFDAYRVGSSGSTTKDMSGDYLYVYLKTNNITSLGGTNQRTSTLSYSPTLFGTTANPSDAWGSNGYKAWFNVSAVQQTLTIAYVYSDDYFTTRSTLYVQAASIPLDIAFNGTGIGLGTHAESPNLFDIGFSTNIRGNLHVSGGVVNGGATNQFTNDLLLINVGNPYSTWNYDCSFGTEDASTLKNSPVTSGPFYAYRRVYQVYSATNNHYKTIVELHEAYPQRGRVWKREYDPNNGWTGYWSYSFTNGDTIPISNGGTGATSRANAYAALQAGGGNETDANIVAPGVYVLNTGTGTNLPSETGYYIIYVMRYHTDDLACGQLALNLGSNTLYHRLYVTGVWREWKAVEDISDSGWITASVTGSFALYGSDSVLRYRKIGNIVQVEGTLKPTTTITGSATNLTIFTLPVGYRPSAAIVALCQGSGSCHWALTIKTSGEVCFARYSSGGSYTSADTGTWLPFHHTFMV